ncbi:hypothetical protein BGZ83_008899 [Gryganskiella cystojenkinii]|nr:hypothetical protein BGZ83_008899 [Gryganskiella cystojenkinii]
MTPSNDTETRLLENPIPGETYPNLRTVITGQSSLVERHSRRRSRFGRRNSAHHESRKLLMAPKSSSPALKGSSSGTIFSSTSALFTRSQSSLMKLYLSRTSSVFSSKSFDSMSEVDSLAPKALSTTVPQNCALAPIKSNNDTNGFETSSINQETSSAIMGTAPATASGGRARRLFEQQLQVSTNNNSSKIKKKEVNRLSIQRVSLSSNRSTTTPASPKVFSAAWSPLTATPALKKSRQSAMLSVQILSSPILSSMPPPSLPKTPNSRSPTSLRSAKAPPKRLSEITPAMTSTFTPAQESSAELSSPSPPTNQGFPSVSRPPMAARQFSFFQKHSTLYDNLASSCSDSHLNSMEQERLINDAPLLSWSESEGENDDDDNDGITDRSRPRRGASTKGIYGGSQRYSSLKARKAARQGTSLLSINNATEDAATVTDPDQGLSREKKPSLVASWVKVMTSWSGVNLHLQTKKPASEKATAVGPKLDDQLLRSASAHPDSSSERTISYQVHFLDAEPTPASDLPGRKSSSHSILLPPIPQLSVITRAIGSTQSTPDLASTFYGTDDFLLTGSPESRYSQRQRQQGNQLRSFPPGNVLPSSIQARKMSTPTPCNCYHRGKDATIRLSCLLHKDLPELPLYQPLSPADFTAVSPSSSLSFISALTTALPEGQASTSSKKNRGSMFFETALSSLKGNATNSKRDAIGSQQQSTKPRRGGFEATGATGRLNNARREDINSSRLSILSFVSSKRSSNRSSTATSTLLNQSQWRDLPPLPADAAANIASNIMSSNSGEKKTHRNTPSSTWACYAGSASRPSFQDRQDHKPPRTHAVPGPLKRSTLQLRLYDPSYSASSPQLLSEKGSSKSSSVSRPRLHIGAASYSDAYLPLFKGSASSLVPSVQTQVSTVTALAEIVVPALNRSTDTQDRSEGILSSPLKGSSTTRRPSTRNNIDVISLVQRRNSTDTVTITSSSIVPTTITSSTNTKCEKEKFSFFQPFQAQQQGRPGANYVSFHFDLSHLEESDLEHHPLVDQRKGSQDLGVIDPQVEEREITLPAPPPPSPALLTAMVKRTPTMPSFCSVFRRPSFLSSMPTLSTTPSSPTFHLSSLQERLNRSTATIALTSSSIDDAPTAKDLITPESPLQVRSKPLSLKFVSDSMPDLLPQPTLSPEFVSSIQMSLRGQPQEYFYHHPSLLPPTSSTSPTPRSSSREVMVSNTSATNANHTIISVAGIIDSGPGGLALNTNKGSSSFDISSTTAFAVVTRKPESEQASTSSPTLSPSLRLLTPAPRVEPETTLNRLNTFGLIRRSPVVRDKLIETERTISLPSPPPPSSVRPPITPHDLLPQIHSDLEENENEDREENDGSNESSPIIVDMLVDPIQTLEEHLVSMGRQRQQQAQHLQQEQRPQQQQQQQQQQRELQAYYRREGLSGPTTSTPSLPSGYSQILPLPQPLSSVPVPRQAKQAAYSLGFRDRFLRGPRSRNANGVSYKREVGGRGGESTVSLPEMPSTPLSPLRRSPLGMTTLKQDGQGPVQTGEDRKKGKWGWIRIWGKH